MCLVLYLLITLALLMAGLYAFITGAANNLSLPYDPDGQACGLNYPAHPYIYFPSPQYDSLFVTTCVSQCPNASTATVNCKVNSLVQSCLPNNSLNNTKAFHVYPTYLCKNGSIEDGSNVCMAVNPAGAALIRSAIVVPVF